ncbi:response regulator [Granulosicoccus sp. 3-233]|uniref:response regulator n=1 Tax=Granulosicoccus sp. 3-233 TaxID=3417969 RepID=UPI003D33706C
MTGIPLIKTVITIDDEPVDQMIYKRVLKRSGIVQTVMDFQLAEEALNYFRKDDHVKPDIIFLDIHMPRMNGFEFLDQAIAEFGQEFAESVVIMLTTSLDPADRERASRYPMVLDYLSKPLTVENVQLAARYLTKAA